MSKIADEMTLERLDVVIDADIQDFSSALNRAERALNEFSGNVERGTGNTTRSVRNLERNVGTSSGSMVQSFAGLGKAAVSAFAVKEVIQFGQECLSLASDLQEVQNVVDVTFGSMSDKVNQFASNAIDQFGLSEKAAKQYVGTMGAMLKSSGLTQDASLEMSTTLTALSADLASFYNLTNEEAFGKIRAGISGETEPLKQLGINMSVANLEAYALSQGIDKAYNSMNQAEQATLRYNYLIATTASQQGDFARTSDSWANQTKTLSMRFDELKASIGNGLIPLFTPLLELVNTFISGLNAAASALGNLFNVGSSASDNNTQAIQLDTTVSDVSENLGVASTNAKGVADGIKQATSNASALKNTLSGFDDANVLSGGGGIATGSGGALGSAIGGLNEFNTALDTAYGGLSELLSTTDSSASVLKEKFGNISLSMGQIRDIASQIVDNKDLEKMQSLTNSISTMGTLADNINEAKNVIDSYNWMVSIGMELTKEDEVAYKKAINDFTSGCQAYVVEQKKAVDIACQIVFGAGSQQETEFNAFYTSIEGQLASLGTQIEKKVNDAWADGLLTFDEAKEIENLQSEMYTIMSALNQAEFNVELNSIEAKFSGQALSKESYDSLIDNIQTQLDTFNKGQDEALKTLDMGYQARLIMDANYTQNDYERDYKKALKEVADKKATMQQEAFNFQINTVLEMIYKDEAISEALSGFNDKIESTFNNNLGDMKFNASDTFWQDFLTSTNHLLQQEVDKVSPEQRKIIEGMLEKLEPQEADLKKIKTECEKAGVAVPESVSDGLSQIEGLKALTGDVDAMYYLMGNQMSNSKDLQTALDFAQKNGVKLPQSILDGMNSKKVDLTNGVDGLLTGVGSKISKDTSVKNESAELGKKVANTLGTNMSSAKSKKDAISGFNSLEDYLSSKIKGEKGLPSAFKTFASSSINGFKNNINTTANKNNINKEITGVTDSLKAKMRSNLGIKDSSSSMFKTYGLNTIEGYTKGITDAKTVAESERMMGNWAAKLRMQFKKELDINSPSKVFGEFGVNTIEGYDNAIERNMTDSVSTMKNWGSNIKKWGKQYIQQDFGDLSASASINGRMSADITGNLTTALNGQNNTLVSALREMQGNFYAEVSIGGEKHVVKFVKEYNKLHAANPRVAFNP